MSDNMKNILAIIAGACAAPEIFFGVMIFMAMF